MNPEARVIRAAAAWAEAEDAYFNENLLASNTGWRLGEAEVALRRAVREYHDAT